MDIQVNTYSCILEVETGKNKMRAASYLTAEQNSIVITTKGEWWWIHGISMNKSINFDISGIDTTSKNFVIDETEFRIERKNSTEIHIEMAKNQTGAERVLYIGLEAGDYFDGIKITQSAN